MRVVIVDKLAPGLAGAVATQLHQLGIKLNPVLLSICIQVVCAQHLADLHQLVQLVFPPEEHLATKQPHKQPTHDMNSSQGRIDAGQHSTAGQHAAAHQQQDKNTV